MGSLMKDMIEKARNAPMRPLLPHMVENKKLGGYGEALNMACMLGTLEESVRMLVAMRKKKAPKAALDYCVAQVENAYKQIKYWEEELKRL